MATDPPDATGRTLPAQSPVILPDDLAAVKITEAEVVVKPDGTAPPPTSAQAPPISPPVPAVPIALATDEEQVLLTVLRLLDGIISPGTLSPIERAFVAGAKVIFDHLSTECDRMLKRKVSDLTGSLADPTLPPESAGNDRPPAPTKPPPRRSKKKYSPPDT